MLVLLLSIGYAQTDSTDLPVEYTSVSYSEGVVTFSCIETQNDYFGIDIVREDGLWDKVAYRDSYFPSGNGDTTYVFEGIYGQYFRILQVDLDGNYSYSKAYKAEFAPVEPSRFWEYQNKVYTDSSEPSLISVVSMDGSAYKAQVSANSPLDLSTFPTGVYAISTSEGTLKVVIETY